MAERHEVTSTDYPYLLVRVEVRGASEEARALIDTGYTGALIIPNSWLGQSLGLPDGQTAVEVGDGRILHAPVYLGTLAISGPVRGIAVTLLGDEFILGRRILERYEITLDHGLRVIVRGY